MSVSDFADRRIAQKERELAKIQTEETLPQQLESAFAKESLKNTLDTAAVFADTVVKLLDDLGYSLEEGLGSTGDNFVGRPKEKQ